MINKLKSLRVKFSIITFLIYFTMVTSIVIMCYYRFASTMIDHYKMIGYETIGMASEEINIDHIPDYLAGRYQEEYRETLTRLNRYTKHHKEIYYLYAYKINKGTTATIIFDAYTTHKQEDIGEGLMGIDGEGEPLGADYELEPGLIKVLDQLQKGEEIEPLIDNTEYGYLMTCSTPLIDSNGVCQGYLFVDFNLTRIKEDHQLFMGRLYVIALIIMLIMLYGGMRAVSVRITTPIEKMYKCISGFKYGSDKDKKENIERLRDLDIHTNPEIQSLYNAILSSYEDSYTYMHEYQMANEKLGAVREIAYTDTLTSLRNKAAYDKKIKKYQEKLQAGMLDRFALAMVDINDLKYVNDHYGHKRGDDYIRGCCGILQNICRKSDLFRIGGDEIVILFENEDLDNYQKLCKEMEEAFDQSYNKDTDREWEKYSAAIGLALLEPGDIKITDIVKRADREMYAAKAAFKKIHGSYR